MTRADERRETRADERRERTSGRADERMSERTRWRGLPLAARAMTRGLHDDIHKESMGTGVGTMDAATRTSGALGDGSTPDARANLRRASRPLVYTKVGDARPSSRDRSLHRISRYWLGESPWIAPFTPSFAAAAARNCSACA